MIISSFSLTFFLEVILLFFSNIFPSSYSPSSFSLQFSLDVILLYSLTFFLEVILLFFSKSFPTLCYQFFPFLFLHLFKCLSFLFSSLFFFLIPSSFASTVLIFLFLTSLQFSLLFLSFSFRSCSLFVSFPMFPCSLF